MTVPILFRNFNFDGVRSEGSANPCADWACRSGEGDAVTSMSVSALYSGDANAELGLFFFASDAVFFDGEDCAFWSLVDGEDCVDGVPSLRCAVMLRGVPTTCVVTTLRRWSRRPAGYLTESSCALSAAPPLAVVLGVLAGTLRLLAAAGDSLPGAGFVFAC